MSKTRPGKFLLREVLGAAMSETTIVKHDGLSIRFATPSVLTRYRAATFATKEPETIEWINAFAEGSTFLGHWRECRNLQLLCRHEQKMSHICL